MIKEHQQHQQQQFGSSSKQEQQQTGTAAKSKDQNFLKKNLLPKHQSFITILLKNGSVMLSVKESHEQWL